MAAMMRIVFVSIGILVGCALTLVVLGLPELMPHPHAAMKYFIAASAFGGAALLGSIIVGVVTRKRTP